jgi:ATP-dependent Clp protease adaptor protein ClpS
MSGPRAAAEARGAERRTRTRTAPAEATQTDVRPAFPWNVIVWDDPVNLMSYVVYVFQKLFGWNMEKATQHMLEVHTQGRSVVASAGREQAEYWVTRLHGYGLQATLERPDASG